MMMQGVELPQDNPYCGAAYQSLYETYCPSNIKTRTEQDVFMRETDRIWNWAAATQPQNIADGYMWAIGMLRNQVSAQLANNELANRIAAARATLPAPPLLEAGLWGRKAGP